MKVCVPRCAKTIRKTFFSVRACNSRNSLPQHVIEAQSTNSFKNRLDKFWSDNPRLKPPAVEPIIIRYQVGPKQHSLTTVASFVLFFREQKHRSIPYCTILLNYSTFSSHLKVLAVWLRLIGGRCIMVEMTGVGIRPIVEAMTRSL